VTFGAVPAWLGWLILAAAGALAVRLFLVKLRPPRMFIPSLLLWRRVLDDAREQTLWERIRRAVSLVVTVLIALALALAAVRPGRSAGGSGQAAGTGRLLIVMDSSLSMEASTGRGETRWARGIAEARRLFASSSGAELALATTADGLVEGPTTDLALLESALDRVRPGGGDAAAWPRLAGASAVHFITDGAAARTIDAAVTVHTVFEPADNVGITALEVRPSLTPGTAGDAYLEIGNFAAAAQKVRLRVTRGEVGALDREFDMGPSEVMRQVIPVPQGGGAALRVHVEAPKNALEADDNAFAWVARSRPVTIAVVGDRVEWLREAFARDPGVRAIFLTPSNWTAEAAARTDMVIFDRWAPRELPAVPTLLFAPPPGTPWLTAGDAPGSDERRPRWEVPGSHPVVQGVDPFTLTIELARSYTRPSLTPVAQTTKGTPLVYVDESMGSRIVVVTFGAHESNLTSAPGFPVLLGNAVDWLARPTFFVTAPGVTAPASVRPGLVTLTGTVQRVTGPDKSPVALTRVSDKVFAVLKQPGLYSVEAGRARDTFAVNVADPQLSNLTRTSAFASTRGRPVTAGSSAWAWWVYCALAAFALAVAEWWTWQRRITV
jgi:hypothetical protein